MKTILAMTTVTVLGAIMFATTSNAQPAKGVETKATRVHETKSQVEIELNDQTVICSRADYSAPMLKVLIPQLGDLTLLNHQNRGAGAPCVTTGESCVNGQGGKAAQPEDILQGAPGKEKIEITVRETREEFINHAEQSCSVTLTEDVETVVRGKTLHHTRSTPLGERVYADCL